MLNDTKYKYKITVTTNMVNMLSPTEKKVLECFSYGMLYDDICEYLCITKGTLRAHLQEIYHKLGITDKVEATCWAIKKWGINY